MKKVWKIRQNKYQYIPGAIVPGSYKMISHRQEINPERLGHHASQHISDQV